MSKWASLKRNWLSLGRVRPESLADARLQLHWASQIVGSLGQTLLEIQEDDSQPNLGWVQGEGLLAGHFVGVEPFQAAVRVEDLTLTLRDRKGRQIESFPLQGQGLESGYRWLARVASGRAGGEVRIRRMGYDLPPHAVEEGAPFSLDSAALAELARWFSNADRATRVLADPHHADVRCWPHHFDLGALVLLEPDEDPETARSIGFGMEPGDDSFPEPYFYMNPYNPPEEPRLPPVEGGGSWHTEGWLSAVLKADDLIGDGSGEGQAERLAAYLDSSFEACHRVLGFRG